jgi:pimeloyl-ACP methyl ester carboxylesterase
MPRPVFACLLLLFAGCALSRQGRNPDSVRSPAATGVVFVANGAGDFRVASQRLSALVIETGAPLEIELVDWSRGYGRSVTDQVDRDNQVLQGRRLAEQVIEYRQAHPERRICLLGHSAGGAVVLSAAECLPPGSVDRMVLLSPSTSTQHDLRPVLRACREGIDHFHSRRDFFVLGLGMRIVGTTDGDHRPAAGKLGYRPMTCHPEDAILYAKLRQHPWEPSQRATGHNGFHFGNIESDFMRAYVLPLLVGPGPAGK